MSASSATSTGSFWLLALAFVGSSAFFTCVSIFLGKRMANASDGCLLALTNVVVVLLGATVGYRLFQFPFSVIGCLTGSILFPFGITCVWIRRTIRGNTP